MSDGIFLGKGEQEAVLLPKLANRHGLITGATGTGKTVTLQGLAEGFSKIGVPVFMADVKGDLAGISQAGGGNAKIEERAQLLGLAPLDYRGNPVVFWDLFGELGHPIRTTVSEMGPLLLSRLLELNDTQEGVLNLAFKLADDEGLLLLDLNDLRAILTFVSDNAKEIQVEYGNVSAASVGSIQRALLVLEQQGGEGFFGEPALDLHDLMRVDHNGRGIVNVLAADKLMQSPRLYATFLLWLISELFEDMPEVGDLEKPKLVFFFDEAHLLFDDAPKALVDKVEQVVRLIRSKGIGVYFISQSPVDVPDTVLGQLGNRVQHALRAFTPRDQKAVKVAAETFRANPKFSTEEAITNLAVGEALVSLLDPKGAPCVVERIFVRPPVSRLGVVSPEERRALIASSPVSGRYDQVVDRESAFEILRGKAEQAAIAEKRAEEEELRREEAERQQKEFDKMQREAERDAARQARSSRTYEYGGSGRTTRRSSRSDSMLEATTKSVLRSAGSQLGRQLVRGILGSLMRGR
jgi:DNA helicase HerA-like ATPase